MKRIGFLGFALVAVLLLPGTVDVTTRLPVGVPEVYVRYTPNGEWKRLYDSGVLTWANDPVTLELNIAGARQLKLRCTDAGDGHFGDVSVWACANVD